MSSIEASGAAPDEDTSLTIAGQSLAAWAYALRIWIAMLAALYAAFWLQLDSASSSAVTVAILAQPKRGQALQKAFFRTAATLIGFLASLAITALFAQSRDLFVVAFALWLAGCVYIASLYDGNRAYGAVLSGYTVAIISVMQVDSPQNVFNDGISRVAVVVLGIAAIALVNDTFAAPELYPDVKRRMRTVAADVESAITAILRGDGLHPESLRKILATMTALRLDVLTLPSERPDGWRQSAAGQSALAAMVAAMSAARAVSLMRPILPADAIDAAARRAAAPAALAAALDQAAASGDPRAIALARFSADVVEQRDLARREVAAMEAGRRPERAIDLPIHREKKEARRKAIRVFLAVVLAAPVFVHSSWPMTSVAFSLLGVTLGLSATTPNPKAFATGAVIAMPLAVAAAGVTEFLVLDGVDSFPLLAVGMAPVVFVACFLSLHPKTGGIGFLLLVFFPVLLMPANPQSYNPQTYILVGLLAVTAVMALAVALNCFVPTSDKERRRWMVERLRDDLLDAAADRAAYPPAQAVWLAADRIVQVSNFAIGCEQARRLRLRYMLLMVHLILATGSAQEALDTLGRELADPARDALAGLHPEPIAAAARRLAAGIGGAPEATRPAMIRAVAGMSFLADALAARRDRPSPPAPGAATVTAGFTETAVGGVLFAPFVRYSLAAFAIFFLLLRPLLRRLPMGRIFANPPLVSVCMYVLVLAALMVFV